jgi:hypothetical protein
MAKKRNPVSDAATIQIHKIHAGADAIVKLLSEAMKWGSLVYIFYLLVPVAMAMAGKETSANFSLSLIANEHFVALLGILFGTGGIIYGRRQSKLRRDTIERFHPFQLKYELEKDPGRSSSKLTPRGDTQEEDV